MTPIQPPTGGEIIVVDDDLMSLRLLSELLGERGYQVRGARSASAALMMAHAAPPQLFLLDIQMPGVNGFQLCQALKRDPLTRSIPVLFISAGDDLQDRIKSFEVGGVDYITKPFQAEETLARVKAQLTIYQLHTDLMRTNGQLQLEVFERQQSQQALQSSETSLRAQYDGSPLPTYTWVSYAGEMRLADYNTAADTLPGCIFGDCIGAPATDIFADHPEVVQDMLACLETHTPSGRELTFRVKPGGAVRELLMRLAYVPPNQVLMHTEDITARKLTERELVNRFNDLDALHNISKILSTEQDLHKALQAVCGTVAQLFRAPMTEIVFQRCDGDEGFNLLIYEQDQGFDLICTQMGGKKSGAGLLGLPQANKPLVLTDLDDAPLPEAFREAVNRLEIKTVMVTPLLTGRDAAEALILCRPAAAPPFTQSEIELVETIAGDIAAAIKHENLTYLARMAAVDAERQRLARDLHDSVTQSIYSLTLFCSGWETMARQGTLADPADCFHYLGEVGQQALREMRLLLYQLRPTRFDDGGLVEALNQRLDSVELRANVRARLQVQGDLSGLPHRLEEEFFNIAQEALNNSLKHSRAEHVQVMLVNDQTRVMLVVEDDGKGFDPQMKYAGMGLATMQERARGLGGSVEIESAPGRGARVCVAAPLPF